MTECRRYRIEGRVQGVWFRESTRSVAEPLGITGHALNLDDGAVEVVACGRGEALERLETWLQHGPTQARVDGVERFAADIDPPESFSTG